MKTLFKQIQESLLAIVVFLLLFLFSATLMLGQQERRVVMMGRVSAPVTDGHGAHACLISVNGEEMDIIVRANGKFWVNAPEAERYTLRFEQNGCMTKDVVLDGHHAARAVSKKKERVIAFDVKLHADDTEQAMQYDGPVGQITFHKSNGRMKVSHHYQLIRTEPPALIAGEGPEDQE